MVKKLLKFILFIFVAAYSLFAEDSLIPPDAEKWKEGWIRELKSDLRKNYVSEMWDLGKKRLNVGFRLESLDTTIAFHKNGTTKHLFQYCMVYDCGPDACGGGERTYGKVLEFYENGQLKREHCESPDFAYYSNEGQRPGFELCGAETEYNPDSSIKAKKEHRKCTIPCGRFQPFIREGEYPVLSDVKVRKGVGLDAPAIEVIKKGTKVKVIRDTQKISTIFGTTAPWVEIEYGEGKKGFMFGGLLEFLAMDTKGFDFATLLNVERIDMIPEFCYVASDSKGNPTKRSGD
jgi:hypothetical protein